jgi:hypothetical protein
MAKDVFKVTIKSAFDVEPEEDVFYFVKTDIYQYPRLLTSIKLELGTGGVMYGLTHNDEGEMFFSEKEISETENVMMRQKYNDDGE